MRAAVTAFTGRGSRLAAKLLEALRAAGWEASAWIPGKYMDESLASAGCLANPLALSDWMEARMREETDAFVFVGACGIAVRAVAPWVNHKSTDPAVLAVDERGIHVISLLSGHVGGANCLARELAQAIGGRPVITTATDLSGLFAVDEFAAGNGLHLSDWALAKQCAARLLEGERLGILQRVSRDRGDAGLPVSRRRGDGGYRRDGSRGRLVLAGDAGRTEISVSSPSGSAGPGAGNRLPPRDVRGGHRGGFRRNDPGARS